MSGWNSTEHAGVPSYADPLFVRLNDRVLELTTQRENLRAALEDVEADPAFPKLCVRLRKRIADLLETT
jgi:hypothetical protein